MPKFNIVEFDNDYRVPSGFFTKEFAAQEEAEMWCREQSWRGLDYFLDPRIHKERPPATTADSPSDALPHPPELKQSKRGDGRDLRFSYGHG